MTKSLLHSASTGNQQALHRSLFCDDIQDLWFKDAIIYGIDVKSYCDANGDGFGDFEGLSRRLDYLCALGINCLWLQPFYPSPLKDNGYDISHYYAIDERLGTLGEFVEFMHLAHQRGIRVLVDLVVNHTSDQHQWFQIARRDRTSKYHDFYQWSDTKPTVDSEDVVFAGTVDTTWSFDDQAQRWYHHRFFPHQPDLNIANPQVRDEIRKIMGFWLQLGVSGFRVDAAPYLIEQPEVESELRTLREFLSWRRGDAIFLAEADVPADQLAYYFGDGTKMHMLFNFLVAQATFAALATQSNRPLMEQLAQLPQLPQAGQWASFLRTHDECNLSFLSEELREAVVRRFGHEEQELIFERGLRRRLAPMFEGDVRMIQLANSLMFTMPGAPVIYYGDEIGMGDDLSLHGREAVRTPMQWSDRPNGGFSTAPTEKLVRPVISTGSYSYRQVNVVSQRRDRDSLLAWMQALIRMRRQCPEISRGQFSLLDSGNPAILLHRFDWVQSSLLAIHNLSETAIEVNLSQCKVQFDLLVDLFGDQPFQASQGGSAVIAPLGFHWLRVERSEP